MSDPETRLRRTLAHEAGRAPSATGLVDDVRARVEVRERSVRRPWLVAIGGVLVTAAIGVAVLVGQRSPQTSPALPVTVSTSVLETRSATSLPTTTPAPARTTTPAPATTTIYGTSGSAVTSRVVTGPLPTDPVTITVSGAP